MRKDKMRKKNMVKERREKIEKRHALTKVKASRKRDIKN